MRKEAVKELVTEILEANQQGYIKSVDIHNEIVETSTGENGQYKRIVTTGIRTVTFVYDAERSKGK